MRYGSIIDQEMIKVYPFSNMVTDNRLLKLAAILILALGLGWLLTTPYSHHETDSKQIPFETKYSDNNQIELGNQVITMHGSKGTTVFTYDYNASLLGWLFDKDNQRSKGKILSKVVVEPMTQEVQRGTLKYQYMWCTNGTSRSYTDEQFADPLIGFTSSSPDDCSLNGQGRKEKIANARGPRCRDVTTYDYNWNNDMICTNVDGSTFYTSYSGASSFLRT
jgi:hypothetical protein